MFMSFLIHCALAGIAVQAVFFDFVGRQSVVIRVAARKLGYHEALA